MVDVRPSSWVPPQGRPRPLTSSDTRANTSARLNTRQRDLVIVFVFLPVCTVRSVRLGLPSAHPYTRSPIARSLCTRSPTARSLCARSPIAHPPLCRELWGNLWTVSLKGCTPAGSTACRSGRSREIKAPSVPSRSLGASTCSGGAESAQERSASLKDHRCQAPGRRQGLGRCRQAGGGGRITPRLAGSLAAGAVSRSASSTSKTTPDPALDLPSLATSALVRSGRGGSSFREPRLSGIRGPPTPPRQPLRTADPDVAPRGCSAVLRHTESKPASGPWPGPRHPPGRLSGHTAFLGVPHTPQLILSGSLALMGPWSE